MKPYTATGDKYTPNIDFDPIKGVLEIKGRSIPEHPVKFYQPLLDWVEEYAQNPRPVTTVNVHMEYLNSGSSRYFLEFFRALKKIDNGETNKVMVNWYYDEYDEDILDVGEDIHSGVDLPFTMVEVADEGQ